MGLLLLLVCVCVCLCVVYEIGAHMARIFVTALSLSQYRFEICSPGRLKIRSELELPLLHIDLNQYKHCQADEQGHTNISWLVRIAVTCLCCYNSSNNTRNFFNLVNVMVLNAFPSQIHNLWWTPALVVTFQRIFVAI